ncbi:Ig-like domain-containing protein [Aeromicrobium sp. CF4.19]|uniref:L,D-transpeptidase n=1 Tax=Aeromicrobium sp. CF4.19 TaxID=3373082 RepID=UPI003EE4DEAE
MRLRPALVLVAAALVVSACSADAVRDVAAPEPDPAELASNIEADATDVSVDTLVEVSATLGELDDVTVASRKGKYTVEGEIEDGVWKATQRLEPGVTYVMSASGTHDDTEGTLEQRFTTQDLGLDQQTYPAVSPLEGETVGVGMPIIVTFDLPVQDKALYEENMHVRTDADIEGSWNWFSDNVAHFRPKEYWPAGTDVTVDLEVNSLPAGNGIYGQEDQSVPFTVGSEVISTVDTRSHTMTVKSDGKVLRTIPVSTGKPGKDSRNGTKVIMEKYDAVDMDAASTGVSEDDADYYNLSDVKWAMRVTNSGEFIHAAPWSVGSQGNSNVSAGCVGMTTSDAAWLYQNSKRGDVVEFVGSPRGLEDQNGWTDWNVDWDTWKQGSALDGQGDDEDGTTEG